MRPGCQPGKNAASCSTVLTSGVGRLLIGRTGPPSGASGTTEVAYQASLKPGFDAPGFLVRYVLRSEAPRILDRVERIANGR